MTIDYSMSSDDARDVAVDDLTHLARDRYLTAGVGERPFDFADDVAAILTLVSTNVGGPSQLFEGQATTPNVERVRELISRGRIAEHTDMTPASPGRGRIDTAADTLTAVAREAITLVDDTGHSPYAFADDVADILTRVTDNLGGISELFAGQDVTSNVDHVAQLIGTDLPDQLPTHRSEPIQIPLYIDSQFDTFGLRDQLLGELVEVNLVERDTRLSVEERNEATNVMQAMRDQYTADKTAYIGNYTTVAKTMADAYGLRAPVEVVAIHDDLDHDERDIDPLTSQLHRELAQATQVPPSGKAPKEHPGQSPADIAPSFHSRIDDHPAPRAPRWEAFPNARPTQITRQDARGELSL